MKNLSLLLVAMSLLLNSCGDKGVNLDKNGKIKAVVISPNGQRTVVQVRAKNILVKINQVDTARYPEVKLYVSVTDPDGNPLEIESRDFFIEENGDRIGKDNIMKILQLKKMKEATSNISAVLAIDNSGSMRHDKIFYDKASESYRLDYAQKLRVRDRPMSFAKEASKMFVDMRTSDDSIEALAFDGFVTYLGANQKAIDGIDKLDASGYYTALYAALYKSVERLRDKSGAKSVILLTDGQNDMDPEASRRHLDHNLAKYTRNAGIKLANKYSIPVFTIGFGQAEKNPESQKVLKHIAEATDGFHYETTHKKEIKNLYRKIRQVINNQYMIRYVTENFETSTKVKVKYPGMKAASKVYKTHRKVVKEAKRLHKKIIDVEKEQKRLEKKEKKLIERKKKLDQKDKKLEELEKSLEKQAKNQKRQTKKLVVREEKQVKVNESLKKREKLQREREKEFKRERRRLEREAEQLKVRIGKLETESKQLDRYKKKLANWKSLIKGVAGEIKKSAKQINIIKD